MNKITEIKETVSGAVEIIRQIKTREVQESIGKIMDTALITNEIIKFLKTPEMVKNIENFRLISENMNEVSTKMQNAIKQLEETGILNETKGLIKSAKITMDLVGGRSQDLREMSTDVKEMFKSMRPLVDELLITMFSKKFGAIHNILETIKETSSDIYKNNSETIKTKHESGAILEFGGAIREIVSVVRDTAKDICQTARELKEKNSINNTSSTGRN